MQETRVSPTGTSQSGFLIAEPISLAVGSPRVVERNLLMPKPKGRLTRKVAGVVVVSAKECVDDRVSQVTREFSAEVRRLETKIDMAVVGLNAKMDGMSAKMDGMSAKLDGMSAKMDALLQLVGPLFESVRQVRAELDTVKEMVSSK